MTRKRQQPETNNRRPPRTSKRQPLTVTNTDLLTSVGTLSHYTLSAPTHQDEWDQYDLSRQALLKLPTHRLLEILTDTSPDISRAIWDTLRFCNPGWSVRAVRKRGSNRESVQGTRVLQEFCTMLNDRYGATDIVWNRIIIGAWMRGGFFAELVMDGDGRPVDIATPDPLTIRFRPRKDPVLGIVWDMYQYQGGELKSITAPTVRYVPIDPMPSKPYGRSPVAPAIFSSLFLLSILHDVKRVVSQQGWPRIDLAINLERVLGTMPEDVRSNPEGMREWINAVINDVADIYGSLEPDDAYVHTDEIQINQPVAGINNVSMAYLDNVIRVTERMIIRALKTMPLLMGITDGVSEANANRQWEIHVAGIKSLQHLAESLIEYLLDLVLRANGVAAHAEFRFGELRATEMKRDAETLGIRINNWKMMVEAGWADADEAAQDLLGHEAVNDPIPMNTPTEPLPTNDQLAAREDGI